MKDTNRLLGNQVYDGLVILVANDLPRYLLFLILELLQSEYVLVEVELQSLVGVVNAQLFETVFFEVLRTTRKGVC